MEKVSTQNILSLTEFPWLLLTDMVIDLTETAVDTIVSNWTRTVN
jgi:hypothetical protein